MSWIVEELRIVRYKSFFGRKQVYITGVTFHMEQVKRIYVNGILK